MLGSISPFGERTRNQRWWVTVVAYLIGSTASGVAFGAALGLVGSVALSWMGTAARLAVLGAAVGIGLALDLGAFGRSLPTVHRQVNEDWLHRYRGWVYGLGFGAQLGLGVATIVTTSAVYATWVAALLSGSAAAGALIGGTFGLFRAAVLLLTVTARSPDRAYRIDGRMQRWAAPARRTAYALQATLLVAAAAAIVR
jgi:Cytochrome C biogenesis protein transmembrane region